jgi:hypothetical protein
LPDYFGVKTCFVSEVVVDGGDIRARPVADLSYGGVMEPELREHFSGGVYQPLPCTIAGDPALCWHSNGNLKRLFEFVKPLRF